MPKTQKFSGETFGLSVAVRKRIDELINLNLSPSTINLFTSEFSKFDEDTRENIARYIASLLEIQNQQLLNHVRSSKLNKITGTTQQEIALKLKQSNLLRIQNAFNNETRLKKVGIKNNSRSKMNIGVDGHNLRNLMVTKPEKELPVDQQEKEKLRELANKKRSIELAIFEQEQKIKLAEKQLQRAQKNNDVLTQEIKLEEINQSKNKIEEIGRKVKEYKDIRNFPIEILMEEDQTVDFEKDEQNLRDALSNQKNKSISNLRNEARKLSHNENAVETEEITDLNTIDSFFNVEGYDQCEVHEHNLMSDDEHRLVHTLTQPIDEEIPTPDFDESFSPVDESFKQDGVDIFWDKNINQTIENPFDEIIDEQYIAKNLDLDYDDEEELKIVKPAVDKKQNLVKNEEEKNYQDPWALTSEIWSESDEQIIQQNENELQKLNNKKSELKIYLSKIEKAKKIVQDNIKNSKKFEKELDEKIAEQVDKTTELSVVEEKQKIMQEYLERLKLAKQRAKKNEHEINELWTKKEKEWLEREEKKLSELKKVDQKFDEKDLIIKKIKRNSKAKDKKIERIKRERDLFEKELVELKLQQKVEELRKIEGQKIKAMESIEAIEKHEKMKGTSSVDMLKGKFVGHIATTNLISKDRANSALEILKSKANTMDMGELATSDLEVLDNNDLDFDSNFEPENGNNSFKSTNKNDNLINEKNSQVNNENLNERIISSREKVYDINNDESSTEFKKIYSSTSVSSNIYDEMGELEYSENIEIDKINLKNLDETFEVESNEQNRKRVEHLKRKLRLNIISKAEKEELDFYNQKNKKSNSLKRYTVSFKKNNNG